mmetsp:Transcript_112151/g.322390  ORF Transcript_112151/g.322390 Transcript_112151/m.322390 type:complete len:209 (+) Transcript_112151:1152-1778(+)
MHRGHVVPQDLRRSQSRASRPSARWRRPRRGARGSHPHRREVRRRAVGVERAAHLRRASQHLQGQVGQGLKVPERNFGGAEAWAQAPEELVGVVRVADGLAHLDHLLDGQALVQVLAELLPEALQAAIPPVDELEEVLDHLVSGLIDVTQADEALAFRLEPLPQLLQVPAVAKASRSSTKSSEIQLARVLGVQVKPPGCHDRPMLASA